MSNGTTSGTGYMLPPDTNSDYNRVLFQAKRMVAKMRTMLPVRVVKVYAQDGKTTAKRGDVAGAGFVDVQPVVSQIDGGNVKQDHVTIYHIPYTRVYGGDFAIICDPVVNDIGYIHCADRDISTFKDQVKQGSTQTVTPGSQRRNSMSDSLYIGGVLNNAPKQYITATDKGITIVDKNNNKIELTSSGITITPANNTVKVSGNLQVTGSVIAGYGGSDQIGLQTHTHANSGGSGPSGTPNPGS